MKFLIPLMMFSFPVLSYAHVQVNSNLGKGVLLYDLGAGLKDECIHFDPSKTITEDVHLTSYKLTQIKTKEELSDKISMSASVGGSYGTFSGDAKSSFVREIQWNYNSNYILIEATRITQRETYSGEIAELKQESLNVLRESKFKFLESCGNAFATSVDLGGEIFGLIEIKSDTYAEKQKVESSLSASGSFIGGKASGSADFERTIRRLSNTYQVKIEFRHIGGEQVDVPQTADALLNLSGKIEVLSDQHPVVLAVHTRDYSTVSNYLLDQKDPEVIVRQNSIDWATDKLSKARNLYSKTFYILENPNQFYRFNEAELKLKLAYLDEKIIELKNFVARSYSFLNSCDISKIQLDLDVKLPEVKPRTIRRGLNIKCEVKPSVLCGVDLYREQKSSACGVVAPLMGTGPVCGTIYKLDATQQCGIKAYKEARGAVCGVQLYKQCHYGPQKYPGGPRKRGRDSSCGVELFNSCRDQSFGVAEYNTCRDPMHGIEKYETCRHKDFGYEFETCRHFTHGPDTFKSCEITEIGNQEMYCPKF